MSEKLSVFPLFVLKFLNIYLSTKKYLNHALPNVPSVVLLDAHLEVHLEILTTSDHTTNQPILGPSDNFNLHKVLPPCSVVLPPCSPT